MAARTFVVENAVNFSSFEHDLIEIVPKIEQSFKGIGAKVLEQMLIKQPFFN